MLWPVFLPFSLKDYTLTFTSNIGCGLSHPCCGPLQHLGVVNQHRGSSLPGAMKLALHLIRPSSCASGPELFAGLVLVSSLASLARSCRTTATFSSTTVLDIGCPRANAGGSLRSRRLPWRAIVATSAPHSSSPTLLHHCAGPLNRIEALSELRLNEPQATSALQFPRVFWF